jgi:hypothetical protein
LVSELAGFEAVAVESVPVAAAAGAAVVTGVVAEEEAADEAGLAGEVALLVGVASDAGDWAPHGAAATTMSEARRANR